MSTVTRARIGYRVGSERNPGDPFGRSNLEIQPDGCARLDQHTRAGTTSWTGIVSSTALEQFWNALEEADFPVIPRHPVPAGSAIRALIVGPHAPESPSAHIAYHAAAELPGYGVAFGILDQVIRQISEDTVKCVPLGEPIVEQVARAQLP
ncbi:MAG: hypothetical protein ACXVEF_30875 [Polyangiales bacterium]